MSIQLLWSRATDLLRSSLNLGYQSFQYDYFWKAAQGSKQLSKKSCGQLVRDVLKHSTVPQSNGQSPQILFPRAGDVVHPALRKGGVWFTRLDYDKGGETKHMICEI